jgi:hypothetical protein
MANFPNELTVEYSPTFKRQTAYGTALAEAALTKAFRATAKRWSPQFNEKVFYDCSDQYLSTKRTTAQWAEMTLEFETTPQLLGGFFALGHGQDSSSGTDPLTHQENFIAGRVLPVTTLRIGHADGVDTGWVWKDVAVDSIAVAADAGLDSTIRVTVTLVGSGDLAAGASASWADCYTSTPSTLFDAAGALVVNGTDYLDTTQLVRVGFANNIPRAAAFSGGSIHVQRWVRAKRRTYSFGFAAQGIDAPLDALSILARANDGAGTVVANTSWTFGTSGNTFACKIPTGYLAFNGAPQDYLSEALGELAVLNLKVDGRKITSGATEPFNVTAIIPVAEQATAYLTT